MKHKKKNQIKITIFFAVTFVVFSFLFIWFIEGISPADRNNSEIRTFRIEKGESIRQISSRLAKDGLIRSPTAFFIWIKYSGIERNLQAGEYKLKKSMDAKQVAKELTHGKLDTWITLIEGWRIEEIAAKLSKEFDMPEVEFIKVAKEGYMFPDTYNITQEATAGAISDLFISNFNKKITSQMLSDLKSQNISLDEAVILASIVEREGSNDGDRPVIAGILLNRLKIGMPLQADATLQYALGYQSEERSWWKKQLTAKDKEVDSEYNTYKYNGLPPGPISNPGLSSLKAVIYPAKTDYMYYLHDPSGKIHYAQDLSGHNQNIQKYLR